MLRRAITCHRMLRAYDAAMILRWRVALLLAACRYAIARYAKMTHVAIAPGAIQRRCHMPRRLRLMLMLAATWSGAA